MSSEQITTGLRFPLAAVVAMALLGWVWLAPLIVRNHEMRQHCVDQQWELLRLEDQNLERRQFIARIRQSPELIDRLNGLASGQNRQKEETIEVPFDLAIHPDALLRENRGTSKSDATGTSAQSEESLLLWASRRLVELPHLRQACLVVSGGLLLFGTVTFRGTQQVVRRLPASRTWQRLLGRYRRDAAHNKVQGPHYSQVNDADPSVENRTTYCD